MRQVNSFEELYEDKEKDLAHGYAVFAVLDEPAISFRLLRNIDIRRLETPTEFYNTVRERISMLRIRLFCPLYIWEMEH
jgi:predicted lipase